MPQFPHLLNGNDFSTPHTVVTIKRLIRGQLLRTGWLVLSVQQNTAQGTVKSVVNSHFIDEEIKSQKDRVICSMTDNTIRIGTQASGHWTFLGGTICFKLQWEWHPRGPQDSSDSFYHPRVAGWWEKGEAGGEGALAPVSQRHSLVLTPNPCEWT